MRQKKWLTGLSAMLLTTTLAAFGDAEENQKSDATEEHSEHSMMDGAAATIDSVEQTTVYMVDFTTDDGEDVTNHKWVTKDELEAMN